MCSGVEKVLLKCIFLKGHWPLSLTWGCSLLCLRRARGMALCILFPLFDCPTPLTKRSQIKESNFIRNGFHEYVHKAMLKLKQIFSKNLLEIRREIMTLDHSIAKKFLAFLLWKPLCNFFWKVKAIWNTFADELKMVCENAGKISQSKKTNNDQIGMQFAHLFHIWYHCNTIMSRRCCNQVATTHDEIILASK